MTIAALSRPMAGLVRVIAFSGHMKMNDTSFGAPRLGRCRLVLLSLSFLGACTSLPGEAPDLGDESQAAGPAAVTDTFTAGAQDAVRADILLVIDQSGSMFDKNLTVGAAARIFVESLQQDNVDLHLAVINHDILHEDAAFIGEPTVIDGTTPAAGDLLVARIQNGGSTSGFEEAGLESARLALSEPLLSGPNAGFLREDADLHVVFVTDEDDQSSEPTDVYTQFFSELKGEPSKVFLYALLDTEDGQCGTIEPTVRYREVIEEQRILGSVCAGNLSPAFDQLADSVSARRGRYELSQQPVVSSIEVFVEGVPLHSDFWTYNATGNAVVISEGFTPQPGQEVTVRYEVEKACGTNGEVSVGLSGAVDSWTTFSVCAPEGAQNLLVHSFGGKGDVDIYLREGSEATLLDHDARGAQAGSDETLLVPLSGAGEAWHVSLHGFTAYEGVNLQAVFY